MKNISLVWGLIFWTLSHCVYAQADSAVVLNTKITTVTLSSLVNSNASYYGRTAVKKLPYSYLDLRLRTPFGWYASAGGFQLLTEERIPSELHLATGFEFEIGKTLTMDFGYSHSFYAKESPLLQASNPNNAHLSFAIKHYFKSEVETDYSFGKSQDIFVSINNSKDLTILQRGSNILQVVPEVSIVAGTQHFYTTYIEEGRRLGLFDRLPLLGSSRESSETTETTVVSTDFNLLSYSLRLPFIWYKNKNAWLLSYQISVLHNAQELERQSNSFFSLGYFRQF